MFDEIDQSLEKLLEIEFGKPLPFDLSFAVPDKNFRPLTGEKTTLNCFLYDIRENRDLRRIEPRLLRNGDGTMGKNWPAARVRLSYCITAWSPAKTTDAVQPALEEHRLLGQVLEKLLRHPVIPEEALTTALAAQELPLPTTIVLPEDMKANRDFWNAIGGQLRPALDFSITTSLLRQDDESGLVSMTSPQVHVGSRYLIGGTVRDSATPPKPLSGATVFLKETGFGGKSDETGHFQIDAVVPGTYFLTAQATGFQDASRAVTVPLPADSASVPNPNYDIQLIPR